MSLDIIKEFCDICYEINENFDFKVKTSRPYINFSYVIYGLRTNFEVEFDKDKYAISGDGPYKYISN